MRHNVVKVGDRFIGPGHPVFIAAEVGQNHNGSLELALKLISAAHEAGADAVKFQKRKPEICVPEEQQRKPKETPWGLMSYLDYRKRLELGSGDYCEVWSQCSRLRIAFFASVWDIPSLRFMENMMPASFPMIAYKIPSACLTDLDLLSAVAEVRRLMIVSTGMSTMGEIYTAASLLQKKNASFVLCHCNSTYPCPNEDLNLRCILTLQKEFPEVPIGYSGHEVGLATTLAAVALGACYVERHITLDRSMWGTDQAASVEPQGFRRLVKDIRNVEKALGDGVKCVTPGELEAMKKLRRVYGEAQAGQEKVQEAQLRR